MSVVAKKQAQASDFYTLIQGDCLDKSLLRPNSIDLTVTSPPYNLGMNYGASNDALDYKDYLAFSRQWLSNVYRWTKPTGRLCLNIGLDKNKFGKAPVCADLTTIAMRAGWKYHATIIWLEGNISRHTAWGSWMSARAPHVIAPVEVIVVLYKGEWRRARTGRSTISKAEFMDWVKGMWAFNGESAKRVGHEAPFPRELPRRCINLFSFEGDTVLDPFTGSGTTLIEAVAGRREAIGIEIAPKYCALARKRIESAWRVQKLPLR